MSNPHIAEASLRAGTRFPVNRPYAPNAGHKGPYLTPLLKRLLKKKIKYEDPETQKIIKGRVKDALMWRLILSGAQGEVPAIKEILERIDGKVVDKIENTISFKQMGNIIIDGKVLVVKIK